MKQKYMVAMVVEVETDDVKELDKWMDSNWQMSMREGLIRPSSMQLHDVQVYVLGENDEIPTKPTTHLTNLFDGWPE